MKISALMPETVKWPVKIRVPMDNGASQVLKMTAEYRFLNGDELRELEAEIAELRDGERDANGRIVNRDAEFARRVLVGWSGVQDEDRNEVPFNDENRDAVLKSHHAAKGICEAFYDMVNGRRAKN